MTLTGLIFPSKRSSQLGQSIPYGIVSPSTRSINLVYPFRLALWKKENFSLLVLDEVIPNGLYVGLSQPKSLEFRKDMWREALHNASESVCLYPVR